MDEILGDDPKATNFMGQKRHHHHAKQPDEEITPDKEDPTGLKAPEPGFNHKKHIDAAREKLLNDKKALAHKRGDGNDEQEEGWDHKKVANKWHERNIGLLSTRSREEEEESEEADKIAMIEAKMARLDQERAEMKGMLAELAMKKDKKSLHKEAEVAMDYTTSQEAKNEAFMTKSFAEADSKLKEADNSESEDEDRTTVFSVAEVKKAKKAGKREFEETVYDEHKNKKTQAPPPPKEEPSPVAKAAPQHLDEEQPVEEKKPEPAPVTVFSKA